MMKRDMSKTQFQAACRRRGFRREFMGYYSLGVAGVHVYVRNAGPTRREWLACLIRERDKAVEKYGSKEA